MLIVPLMLIAPRDKRAKPRDPNTLTLMPLPNGTPANVNTAILPELTLLKLAPGLIASMSVEAYIASYEARRGTAG